LTASTNAAQAPEDMTVGWLSVPRSSTDKPRLSQATSTVSITRGSRTAFDGRRHTRVATVRAGRAEDTGGHPSGRRHSPRERSFAPSRRPEVSDCMVRFVAAIM
jgi:hypothetical protein